MRFLRLAVVAVLMTGLCGLNATQAKISLPPRSGAVILTVAGLDPAEYPGGILELDLAMLRAMGSVKITTTSIWTDGSHSYTGVPLRTFAADLGIGDRTLSYHALNDYIIEFPASESTGAAPILAYESDGNPMSVRDKGPIWLLYPYDDGMKYRTDTIYTRSIWQLDRIEVLR